MLTQMLKITVLDVRIRYYELMQLRNNILISITGYLAK